MAGGCAPTGRGRQARLTAPARQAGNPDSAVPRAPVDDRAHERRRVATVPCMRTASLHHTVIAGRYAMLDQIGAGGMGSVWRARDERSGEIVAVKVLGQHSAALLVRFVREQAVRVRHPHVVAPISWAADDDLVVLAMDLVTGGSVQDLLDEHGTFPVGYAAVVARAAPPGARRGARRRAGAPRREAGQPPPGAHTGDRPHLRLGDFGVAAPIADARYTTVPGAIGTQGYMAPEQARGALPDPCQDLYSVGRVGLQLVTGLPPERQGAIGSGPLRPLLERLLVVDPEQRLASAEAALRLLRRLDVAFEDGPRVPDRLGGEPVTPSRLGRLGGHRGVRRSDRAVCRRRCRRTALTSFHEHRDWRARRPDRPDRAGAGAAGAARPVLPRRPAGLPRPRGALRRRRGRAEGRGGGSRHRPLRPRALHHQRRHDQQPHPDPQPQAAATACRRRGRDRREGPDRARRARGQQGERLPGHPAVSTTGARPSTRPT